MSNKANYISSINNAPAAIGPYSVAAEYGDLIFCSGQIAINPESGKIISDDFKSQTLQVLKNLAALLEHFELRKTNILKATVFLTDLSKFPEFNALYAEWLEGHKPARSTIGVAALPAGANVEIEVVLHK